MATIAMPWLERALRELSDLVRLPERSVVVERAMVGRARRAGASWEQIGVAVGMTASGAELKWGMTVRNGSEGDAPLRTRSPRAKSEASASAFHSSDVTVNPDAPPSASEPDAWTVEYATVTQLIHTCWEWRSKLVALYLAGLGGVIASLGWVLASPFGNHAFPVAVPLVVGVLLSAAVFMCDLRNERILRQAYTLAKSIEVAKIGHESTFSRFVRDTKRPEKMWEHLMVWRRMDISYQWIVRSALVILGAACLGGVLAAIVIK